MDLGNQVKKGIHALVSATHGPEVLGKIGGFGGLFRPNFRGMKDPVLVSSVDGVGTKLKIAFATNRHDTIGQDLVNHCINDIAVIGARPLFFLDYIGGEKLDPVVFKQILKGFAKACQEGGCALIGGETAQMHGMFKEYKDFDIAGWAIGERKFPFNRETAMSGTFLVGLPSSGVHSNGLTTLRERLNPLTFKSYSREFITPTRIYTKDILAIKDIIHGCAHITGGGLTRNISRILRSRQSFRLTCELDPWWESLAKRLSMNVIEMRSMFNCGWGMVVTTERPEDVMARVNGSAIIGEVI